MDQPSGFETPSTEARAAIARNAFVSAALEAGYVAYLPVCGGDADVVITRRGDGVLRPVILRQAWSATDAIEDVEQWIGFEAGGLWHVAPDGPLLHVVTCRLPATRDDVAPVVDLGRLDRVTLDELADYVVGPLRPPPKPDLAPHKPTPWNVALLACFRNSFKRHGYEERRCIQGEMTDEDSRTPSSYGADEHVMAFSDAAIASGWATFDYDGIAVSIVCNEIDPWAALRFADSRRLGSVITFVERSEGNCGGAYTSAIKSGVLDAVTIRAAEIAKDEMIRAEPVLGERITGALFGASIGDALGLPIEEMSIGAIRGRHGPAEIGRYAEAFGIVGALSGEAQIMLCVAAGLAVEMGWEDEETEPPSRHLVLMDEAVELDRVRRACHDWHSGQAGRVDGTGDCPVSRYPFLRERRPHGRSTALALAAGTERAANDSKGNGCMLRVVPIGLAHLVTMPDEVFRRAWDVAGLTHGHPAAKAAAGVFAVLLSRLVCRQGLREAIGCALNTAPSDDAGREVLALVARARDLAEGGPPSPEVLETLGAGFVAAEALAIAVYCVTSTSSFEAAVLAAVNHSGDSDATGGVAGAIAGALYGTNAIPIDLLRDVEGRGAIIRFAADLAGCTGLEPWTEGGIGENAYDEMITPEDEARAAEAAVRDAVGEGEDVEAAIGAFAAGHPTVAAKMRRWAKRRRKPRAGGQADLLSG